MAIVQISQITQRKGLNIDLPQPLAGAQFGWSTDTRQLYIGNGTLVEGAPVEGNTEILTEFSDILNLGAAYTYKGSAAGYIVQTGPTISTPVEQSMQSWMDQWCSVKDFGAVGDGSTDDTDAINRALYQIYCRDANPQVRRSIFFPAGVYIVSSTINIPTYATLYGEGAENSVIMMQAGSSNNLTPDNEYTAQTADSLQQIGANIGQNGATPPTSITIMNMGFEHSNPYGTPFLVESATEVNFSNVYFFGPLTVITIPLTDSVNAGVTFDNVAGVVEDITFENCIFSGCVFGVHATVPTKGVLISNSFFNILNTGVYLKKLISDAGPNGFKITQNTFDVIYAEGILIDGAQMNATGFNMFYDVGDQFNGPSLPSGPVITFLANNNVSIGDMFARDDQAAASQPRIHSLNYSTISFSNSQFVQLGTQIIESGTQVTLVNNTTSPEVLYIFNNQVTSGIVMQYSIVRDTTSIGTRIGTLTVSPYITPGGTFGVSDDYTENDAGVGVTLYVSQDPGTGDCFVSYTTTDEPGVDAYMKFSVTKPNSY